MKVVLPRLLLLLFMLSMSVIPFATNAQTPVTPKVTKNGICAVFYVEMVEYDEFTKAENKHFKSVAKRYVDTRKGRCYAVINDDLIVDEVNVLKTGENFLHALAKLSRELGPISELYIFAHGVPLGIVGASEDGLGIQKQCTASQCLSPTDFAFAIQQYLTNDANVVLHSCSVSVTPSEANIEDQVFNQTPLSTQSQTMILEQVTATGSIAYPMNITSESNETTYYNGFNASGSLVISGIGILNGKRYPLQKYLHIQEFIDFHAMNDEAGKTRSIPVSADWFIDKNSIPKEALENTTIQLNLELVQEKSFAESLTREIARINSTSKVAVWGHNNYTKAGYNCGWVKHTPDHPEATVVSASGQASDKMPLKLQCGSHKTCDGNSDIVNLKE